MKKVFLGSVLVLAIASGVFLFVNGNKSFGDVASSVKKFKNYDELVAYVNRENKRLFDEYKKLYKTGQTEKAMFVKSKVEAKKYVLKRINDILKDFKNLIQEIKIRRGATKKHKKIADFLNKKLEFFKGLVQKDLTLEQVQKLEMEFDYRNKI